MITQRKWFRPLVHIGLVMLAVALAAFPTTAAHYSLAATQAATKASPPRATLVPTSSRYDIHDYSDLPQSVTADGNPVLGDPDVNLSMTEFLDFSCPHCLSYYPIVWETIDRFVRTGQLKLIVQFETFVGGKYSEVAAQAALCANKEGKFWPMHDALFAIQQMQGYQAFTVENLGSVASDIGLSGKNLAACINSGETMPIIQRSVALGKAVGVQGTPSVLFSTNDKDFKFLTGTNGVPIIPSVDVIAETIQTFNRTGALPVQQQPPTLIPTWTPVPRPTINPAAFDLSYTKAYKTPDGVITIQLPDGWTFEPGTNPVTYRYTYGTTDDPVASLQIFIGAPTELYDSVLRLREPATSPGEALIQLRNSTESGTVVKFAEIRTATISRYTAQAMAISVPGSQGDEGSEVDLLIAPLPSGRIIMVIEQSRTNTWGKAKLLFDHALSTMNLQPQLVPTSTPTATLHPLLITATALGQQILALTPTATSLATSAATQSATKKQ